MTKKSPPKWLFRLVSARPEELPSALMMFFYFFLLTASIYIVKPVKVSLYLKWLKADGLPYAYLVTALLIGFFVTLNSRLIQRMRRQVYISWSLGFFIFSLCLFWALFRLQWRWLSIIFWFWSDLFIVTSVTQFWILINDIYAPRQAKRLVGFLVSGGLLGGIAGALLATTLASLFKTEGLLLVCPLLLAGCLAIVNRVHSIAGPGELFEAQESGGIRETEVGYLDSFRLFRRHRYLVLLAGAMACAIVVTTLIDFQFNSAVERAFQDRVDARTAFLGTFFIGLLIFSYFLHILLTNRILRNFGIRTALLIAPAVLLMGSAAVFFVPAAYLIYWAVPLKGLDKALSHSLNQSVRELLYIPVAPEIKYKAKVFIDMFVNKFADGLAALLLFVFYGPKSVFHLQLSQVSLLTMAVICFWIFLILRITREYVGIVKRNLKLRWRDADRLVRESVDIDAARLVFDTLESKKRSSVLYAMNLLDLIRKEKMTPELKSIISSRADEIRASSMDSLLDVDGQVLVPEFGDILEDKDLDAQIKEVMALDVYQEVMKEHIHRIVSTGGRKNETSAMEAAKVLGMMEPAPSVIGDLIRLLRDDSPEVIRYAAESAGRIRRNEFVPHLIRHLAQPQVREDARKALAAYGSRILGTLKDYMDDPEEDLRVRKELPGIMARSGVQRAVVLLIRELLKENRGVESEVIEALAKMRTEHPELSFPERAVLSAGFRKIKDCYLLLMEMPDAFDTETKEMLTANLENQLSRLLRQVFELLSLIYPPESITRAYQNICDGTKKSIDYSLELLDNILKKDVKDYLFPLVDDLPLEDKVKRARKLARNLEKMAVEGP